MPTPLNFADAFWDFDYCGTNGYTVLKKRMKDGHQVCRDFDDFIKSRAKIEEEYSKALQGLAKKQIVGTELGTLKLAFEELKAQTECMAIEHAKAGQHIMDASKRLNEFMDQQKTQRKQEDQVVSKAMTKKKEMHKQMASAKEKYEQKCREVDELAKQISQLKSEYPGAQTNQWEKIFNKHTKAKTDSEKHNSIYKNLINDLEQTRIIWEKEMVHMCQEYQKLEVERIHWLRNEMWVHSNIISQTCIDVDDSCEAIRCVLEKCNADADLKQFITECKTGLKPPAPIQYEPYQGGQGCQGGPTTLSRFHGHQRLPFPGQGYKTMPEARHHEKHN